MDLLGIGSLVSGAGNLLAGVGGGVAAGLNYSAEMANLDWQKQMQRESWERDDTAVQRRAKDMAAAGINPLLAAGSAAGNSPVVHTEAPQLDPAGVAGFGKGISEAGNSLIQNLSMSKDFAVKDAQAQLLQSQAKKADVEANAVETLLPGNKALQTADLNLKQEQAKSIAYDVSQLKPAEVRLKTAQTESEIQSVLRSKFDISNQTELTALQRARDHNEQLFRAQGISESQAKLAAMAVELQILKSNADVAKQTVGARVAGHYADVVSKIDGPKFLALKIAWPELFSKVSQALKQ